MKPDQVFRVVGIRGNGERLVIARDTDHETAERVANLMAGGAFVELSIEADGEGSPAADLARMFETAH
jgi:hypothetical protein